MHEPVRVAIVGMGGFAGFHRQALEKIVARGGAQHVAQVAPPADHAPFAAQLRALRDAGVRVHDSLRQLLASDRDRIDLLCIPTGIPLHRPMVIAAFEAGVDVLVEKPAAGCTQDVDAMIAARDRHGRRCAVGFQQIYRPSTQRLKEWLVAGRFGRLRRTRGFGCWPRGQAYYGRNGWAGELAVDDTWVLDGPHNNALAHSVNFMGFLAGATVAAAARPLSLQAELYRINPIRAADTVCLRAATAEGVDIFFAASHASEQNVDPGFVLDTDLATLHIDFATHHTTVRWLDGRVEEIEAEPDLAERAVGGAIDWIAAGNEAQAVVDSPPHCSLEVARAQTLIACGSYESSAVQALPDTLRCDGPGGEIAVDGMTDAVQQAFAESALFSELGLDWARAGERVELEGYCYFPTWRMPG